MTLSPITATTEDFQNIPGPNKVNIFIVQNGMKELIWDNNQT